MGVFSQLFRRHATSCQPRKWKQEKEIAKNQADVRERHLKLEGLWLLPGEVLVGEVTVLGGGAVDWLDEVELLDNDTWTHIEVVLDDLNKLVRGLLRSTVSLDEEGSWLSDTNGV